MMFFKKTIIPLVFIKKVKFKENQKNQPFILIEFSQKYFFMNIENLVFNQILEFLKNKKELFKIDRKLKSKIIGGLEDYIFKLI